MVPAVICDQEIAKLNNNVLNEFCNFNDVFIWNKSDGASNATILNNISGRQSYFGKGAVSINFTGTGQVSFNSGGTHMLNVIQRTGTYILSYAFDKSDPDSDINFIVEVFVNGVLQPTNTFSQNLYFSSGFINGQWTTYFQLLTLNYGDKVDFAFKAQSDTTACNLYFDRFKLEIDNRGSGNPTIYTEAPLDVFEEENTLTVAEIADGETRIVTATLAGCKLTDHYIGMKYPDELSTLGLAVGVPSVFSDGVVKFSITNNTGSPVTPTAGAVYNFKVLRG